MRVLHVINSLILAGVEVLLREMAPRIRARGIEISLAVLKTLDSPLEHELRAAGIHFLPIESSIYSPAHIRSLARHIGDYDVVHSYLFPAQLWVAAARASARSRVPLVTTEQSTTNRRRKRWLRPLDRWMYGQYSAIGCNSEATLQNLKEWVPQVADRLSIIYNGVPLDRFRAAHAACRAEVLQTDDPQRALVTFVARFDPAKDHATLLRALVRLPGVELALVGDGDSRRDMEVLAAKLGIGGRVHFLGRRHNIPELLKMSDVYVHSSNWEGFGIAAVEAMSAGLPVIATDVPGLGEIVRGTGLLFAPGDHEALAAHITAVLESTALRRKLTQASLRRASDFSIDSIVDQWIKVYESVVHAPALVTA